MVTAVPSSDYWVWGEHIDLIRSNSWSNGFSQGFLVAFLFTVAVVLIFKMVRGWSDED